jgi:hypothetical protein
VPDAEAPSVPPAGCGGVSDLPVGTGARRVVVPED